MSDYHIPSSIKERIPSGFLASFGEECAEIFDFDSVTESDEEGTPLLFYVTGTAGWERALRTTCQKFDMQWLLDYWTYLDWYEFDAFDAELVWEVIRQFKKEGV